MYLFIKTFTVYRMFNHFIILSILTNHNKKKNLRNSFNVVQLLPFSGVNVRPFILFDD